MKRITQLITISILLQLICQKMTSAQTTTTISKTQTDLSYLFSTSQQTYSNGKPFITADLSFTFQADTILTDSILREVLIYSQYGRKYTPYNFNVKRIDFSIQEIRKNHGELLQESTKELRNNNLYTTFPKNQYSKNVISIGFYMSFLILPDNQIKITYHIIDVMFKYTNSLIPYEIGYAYKIDSFYFIQNQPMPIYDDAKYPSTTQSEPDTLLDIYNIDTQKNIVNYIVNTLSNRIIQLQQLINQH